MSIVEGVETSIKIWYNTFTCQRQIGIFCGGVYMIFLKVLAVVLGLAFLLFGYFIYFKKKYNLINGFEADFKAGRKKEEYAKKVGMIEFVVGIVLYDLKDKNWKSFINDHFLNGYVDSAYQLLPLKFDLKDDNSIILSLNQLTEIIIKRGIDISNKVNKSISFDAIKHYSIIFE